MTAVFPNIFQIFGAKVSHWSDFDLFLDSIFEKEMVAHQVCIVFHLFSHFGWTKTLLCELFWNRKRLRIILMYTTRFVLCQLHITT